MMDLASTLQAPKTGRSRFSKALPAPPPVLDDDPASAPRQLPPLPFPPRRDSVSTATSASRSVKAEHFDSPLPAPPPKADTSQMQSPKNTIPRRPVGQPAPKSNKMKRVSSISSLLSAYSNGTSGSVNRSSQETILTKDSDPSHPREREERDDPKDYTNIFMAYSSNPYGDDSPTGRDDELHFPLPPSLPSLKVNTPPGTPQSMRPPETTQVGAVSTSSPVSLTNESPKQEIWRRRAGSKSDVGIAVPELKLAISHGSTAATASGMPGDAPAQKHEPINNVVETKPLGLPSGSEPRLRSVPSHDIIAAPSPAPQKPLPPQPHPPRGSDDTIASVPQSRPIESNIPFSNDYTAAKSTTAQNGNESKTSTLPPRLTSLPGRNIRPRQQAAPEDDRVTKAKDLDKHRELTPVSEPSNDTLNDFLKVSPGPELQQKTLKGLPPSPRMDTQPANSPAAYTPRDQLTENKSLPRTPQSIARKGLPTPAQSPSNAHTPPVAAQAAKSAALAPSSLPSPDEPPRESEKSAAVQHAAGAAATGSQPNSQQLKFNSTTTTDGRSATGLRRPAAGPLAVGDPLNRAVGVRPARSQQDLGFSTTTMSSNHTPGKQNSFGRRVSPTKETPPPPTSSSSHGPPPSGAQRTVQVGPVVPPSTTPSPVPVAAPTITTDVSQGSDLFDFVSILNNSDIFNNKDPAPSLVDHKRLRARPTLSNDSRPLSQINEVPRDSNETMNRSAEATAPLGVGGLDGREGGEEESSSLGKEINEALSRFPRERLELLQQQQQQQPSGNANLRVWPSRPPGKENYGCWTNHETMVPTRNAHYALACQACGVADRSERKVCSWCSLRICHGCAALLAQSGGDLRRAMEVLKARRREEKGKEALLGYGALN